MRVMIHMLPEPGHMNPSFPLARALRERGHDVVYASILDLEPEIVQRGYRCVPFHRDVCPRGWLESVKRLPAGEAYERASKIWRARMHENFLKGRVEAWIREIDPTIILSDVITYGVTLVAHRMQLPCLRLSTSLSQRLDECPPLTSSLPPDTPFLPLEAARHRSSVVGPLSDGGWIDDIFCARFAYPSDQASYRAVFALDLALYREVLLCASALDFPRRGALRPTYAAIAADLDRQESVPAALEAFVDGRRPLIYACLGSQSSRFAAAPAFFSAVVGALRARPEWHAVIAAGDLTEAVRKASDGAFNVLVIEHAPQLWLLRRAAAFLTHAGLGSVREAVACRTPMIAVPQMNDGFGNAARVRHHGIGLISTASLINAPYLMAQIAHLLANHASYQARLAALDAACRREEAENRGPEIIEAMAAQHGGTGMSLAPSQSAAGARSSSRAGWVFLDEAGELPPGGKLTAGIEREMASTEPLGLGVAGFALCPELAPALMCATGSLLARVEVFGEVLEDEPYAMGRILRCQWCLDIPDVLRDYALWCATLALESEFAAAPEVAAWCKELVVRYQEQVSRAIPARDADSRDRERAAWRELARQVMPVSERASVIVGESTDPKVWDAARFSRWRAIRTLARRSIGAAAGTAAGADTYVREEKLITAQFDSEFVRRVQERINASVLSECPCAESPRDHHEMA